METKQELHLWVVGQRDVAHVPQLPPRMVMTVKRFTEGRVSARALTRVQQRLLDPAIARGIHRDHLLYPRRLPLLHVEGESLLNVILHLIRAALNPQLVRTLINARTRGLGDVDL